MGLILKKVGNEANTRYKEFLCDTLDDLALISANEKCIPSDRCYVIQESKYFTFSFDEEWVEENSAIPSDSLIALKSEMAETASEVIINKDIVVATKNEAVAAKDLAEASANEAKSYSSHSNIILENGNWGIWNGSEYVDSNKSSIGTAGYTPQKGIDYWTPDDVASIQAFIDTELGVINNGSY